MKPALDLSPHELAILTQLRSNLIYFAKTSLKIADKSGSVIPFVLNRAQTYLHEQLEKQIAQTGRVRALIVKGRQQGCSTYVGGRFFHRTQMNEGKRAFILSHLADSTEALFQMTKRFYDNCPPSLRHPTEVANRRTMAFENLSEYRIGTAGSDAIGRGTTVQYFHASECAYYQNADEIMAGILQAVPDLPGTEVIFESTANGMGNAFYRMAMDALQGKGKFQLIFIPWFWQSEYQSPAPFDFTPDDEEVSLIKTYGLTYEQLQWRRDKIVELRTPSKFKQEYPCDPIEAFQTSGQSLISNELIQLARKSTLTDPHAPLILGVDPARDGDRTVVVFRQGRHMLKYQTYTQMNEMLLAGILAKLINEYNPAKVFIDTGYGWGTIDRLYELGFRDVVTGVSFGEGALDDRTYANRRAEMWMLLLDWFKSKAVRIPDQDELHQDISCVPDDIGPTSNGRIILIPKKQIKKDYGRSPDIGDALALTFAYPVQNPAFANGELARPTIYKAKNSGLQTLKRIRQAN